MKPTPSADAKVSLPAWVGQKGWESDVILSTRARLARNLAGWPFPGRAGESDLKAVARQVLPIAEQREKGKPNLRAVEIAGLDDDTKTALVDSHLISVEHTRSEGHRWALVDDLHTVSVMVNEEDHLRIQAILPGLQVEAAYGVANHLDDTFAAHLSYAVDPKYGYLTSSLANCGTGLRLSFMAHLPALALSGKLEEALAAARTLGGAVRGLYGERSEACGDVYQISNAISIGLTERQILARMTASAAYLLTDEQAGRELLWRTQRSYLEDLVTQSQDLLRQADRLSIAEAMRLLSILRLGEHVGLATGLTGHTFSQLLASMRIGASLISNRDAHSVFYEETRRPALIRNTLRAQK